MFKKNENGKDDETVKAARLKKIGTRNALVDNVKGLVVLLYMVDHAILHMPKDGYAASPWWGHSNPVLIPSWGFNIIDLGPILFFFVIGLVYFSSFLRKYETDGRAAYKQAVSRNLAFMGLFLGLMYFTGAVEKPAALWNTVPSIGFASLLAVPFLIPQISKSAVWKGVLGVGVLMFYHFFHEKLFALFAYIPFEHQSGEVENLVHAGGMAACVGYLGIILLSGAIADVSKKGIIPYEVLTALLYVSGRLCSVLVPPSYPDMNVTWMFSALTKINLFYFGFYLLDKLFLKGREIPILAAMGRNIFLYLFIVLIFQGIFAVFNFPVAHNRTEAFWIVAVISVVYIIIAISLQKSKVIFKL
ncbi:MAG: hypothetical protein LBP62_02305 [Clostridiales bacterium]|jgi:hypothetical protein|nr:hypothetical protein [Clostridiales bacterium]